MFHYNVLFVAEPHMRPQLLFRKIHKWAGLILFVQLVFWFLSGFLMSFMPIEEVRGSHILKPPEPQAIRNTQVDLAAISQQLSEPVITATVKNLYNQTVVEVHTAEQTLLFDALNLKRMTPLSESWVQAAIAQSLKPEHQIKAINWLTEVPGEVRGRPAPLWQVKLQGPENPVIYLSPQTGQILATRTDRWRLFDFLWMLHIMDYDERDDFNHPLLYLTALAALLFTITGVVLLFFTLRKRPVVRR